jgi:hypothetical protein
LLFSGLAPLDKRTTITMLAGTPPLTLDSVVAQKRLQEDRCKALGTKLRTPSVVDR